jgi:hypothetical protein
VGKERSPFQHFRFQFSAFLTSPPPPLQHLLALASAPLRAGLQSGVLRPPPPTRGLRFAPLESAFSFQFLFLSAFQRFRFPFSAFS